jgi:hypothetical protein
MERKPSLYRSMCGESLMNRMKKSSRLRRHAESPSTFKLQPEEAVYARNIQRALDRHAALTRTTYLSPDFAVGSTFDFRESAAEIERPVLKMV